MPARKTLNQKRLTKKQVAELIAAGAQLRQDLMDRLAETYADGSRSGPTVYELPDDRFLYVFDPTILPGGKGDLYPGDYFRRFVRWCEQVNEDAKHGADNSVGHWTYHTRHHCQLVDLIEPLVADLATELDLDPALLDKSYPSLDRVSERVEAMGVESAQKTLYDSLVAYVGEVLRQRVGGEWRVDRLDHQHYPYVRSPTRGVLMPINVVHDQLQGLDPVDLRTETANEVRRATAKPGFRDGPLPNPLRWIM